MKNQGSKSQLNKNDPNNKEDDQDEETIEQLARFDKRHQRSRTYHACEKHNKLCGQCFEFTDQKKILKQLNQPQIDRHDKYQLPTPDDYQIRNKNIGINHITEESLDDWIAQSLNRPLVSFLDPYKKFQVPDSLLLKFKQRYLKKFQENPDKTNEKKRLYFEDIKPQDLLPHYMRPIRQPKEMQKDIRVNHQKLQPRNIPGIKIKQREQQNFSKFQEQNSRYQTLPTEEDHPSSPLFNNNHYKYDSPERKHIISSLNKKNIFTTLLPKTQSENRETIQSQSYEQSGYKSQSSIQPVKPFRLPSLNNQPQPKLINSNRKTLTSQSLQNTKRRSITDYRNRKLLGEDNDENDDSQPKKYDLNIQNLDNIQINQDNLGQIVNMLIQENDQISNPFQSPRKGGGGGSGPRDFGLSRNKSQYINNPQAKDLNLHVDFFQVEITDQDKTQLKEEDYFYWRGVRRIIQNKYTEAIICLKDSLAQFPDNFNCMLNLANLYERTQRYELSKRWFQVALSFNQQVELNRFGIALCFYKQNNIERALDFVRDLAIPSSFECRHYTYLRIVCCKILGRFKEADRDYQRFIRLTCPKNYTLLMHFMFAMIFANLRSLEIKFAPLIYYDFLNLTFGITESMSFDPPLKKYISNTQMFSQKIVYLNFFKRFTQKELKPFIPILINNVKYFKKEELIHPEDGYVYIITAGSVIVWDHLNGFDRPTILTYFHEGDIIGANDLDNGLCSKVDTFLQVSSEQLEYIEMKIEDFENLWNLHKDNYQKTIIYNYIKQLNLFQGISDLTLYKLAYEFMNVNQFRINEVIFNSGAYQEKIKYIKVVQKVDKKEEKKKKQKEKTLNQNDFNKTMIKGFYIIKSGIAELQTPSGKLDSTLVEGDFMGENLLFNTESITSYGVIRAKSDPCECIYLSRNYFDELNKVDREIMKKNITSQPKYTHLIQMIKDYELQMQRQKQREDNMMNEQQKQYEQMKKQSHFK